MTWPHRDSCTAAGAVLGILFSFHLAIAVALALADELFVDVVLHGAFAVLCLYLFAQRLRWCVDPATLAFLAGGIPHAGQPQHAATANNQPRVQAVQSRESPLVELTGRRAY